MTGAGVDDPDAERGQRAVEGRGDEWAPVVNEARVSGHRPTPATGAVPPPDARCPRHARNAHDRPAPVVDEGEEDRGSAFHHRPMEAVAGPQLAEGLSFEATVGVRSRAVRPHVQP
jgi:hypothetical protein